MCALKSCCDWFFCFFRSSPPNTIRNEDTLPPSQAQNINLHSNNISPNVNENNFPNNQNNQLPPIADNNNPMYINLPSINTKYKNEEIISNIIPDKLREIKYNCPICLKYYNHILVLSCCKNYLCFYCINSYIDISKKYLSKLKCPLCIFSEKLQLEDVDPKSQVKIYSDSIYTSIKKVAEKEIKFELVTLKGSSFIKPLKRLRKSNSFDNGRLLETIKEQIDPINESILKESIASLRKTYFNHSNNSSHEFKIILRPMRSDIVINKKQKSKFKKSIFNSVEENNYTDKSKLINVISNENSLVIKEENSNKFNNINKTNIINYLEGKIKDEDMKNEIINKEVDTLLDNRTFNELPSIIQFRELIECDKFRNDNVNVLAEMRRNKKSDDIMTHCKENL